MNIYPHQKHVPHSGVTDLEKNNAQQKDQLLALAAEFQAYKEKTETKQRNSDAAMEEAQGKLVGLVKEYGETMAECNAKLSQATETVEAHIRDKNALQQEVGGYTTKNVFGKNLLITLTSNPNPQILIYSPATLNLALPSRYPRFTLTLPSLYPPFDLTRWTRCVTGRARLRPRKRLISSP